MGPRQLGALLRLLRANGVTHYKAGDVELTIGPAPAPAARKGGKAPPPPALDPEDRRSPYEQLASEIWPGGIPRVREVGKPTDEAEVD